MFSKSKINEPIDAGDDAAKAADAPKATPLASAPVNNPRPAPASSAMARPKPGGGTPGAGVNAPGGPSVVSADLKIIGNLESEGDVQIEGTVEGDIRARTLTIGEKALVRGEVLGEDVVVQGKVIGRIRGTKVRLAANARVEGDLIHKTIAIEAGADFEGSVKRSENPLASQSAPAGSATGPKPVPDAAPKPADAPKVAVKG